MEQRLADMTFEGPATGDPPDTATALASLIRGGMSLEAAVLTVLRRRRKR